MQFVKDQRITDSHHKRSAFIYVRQSSSKQVKQNTESQKFQLSLRERAISLGWSMPVVIDDDLGISAAGYAERPGFQKLLTQITMKQVGIIFCVDASRLSRNSKDWAQLFELWCWAPLLRQPPRNTRYEPDDAPPGSVTDISG